MAIFGHFLEKGSKIRDFPDPGRGFYINPSRRGPAVPGEGFLDPQARRGWGQSSREAPGEPSGTPIPGDRPGEPRGPGARGWCKTPLAGLAGPGTPVPGDPQGSPRGLGGPQDWGSGTPDPGPRDQRTPETSGPGPGDPPGAPRGSPPLPRGGFYINPSRRAPAVPRGWSRDATERSPSRPPRPLSVSYWERSIWWGTIFVSITSEC